MVILLGGSTDLVRASVADQLMKDFSDWRHLAIEDLTEAAREGNEEYDEELLVQVVAGCAENMQRDGYHLFVTLSDQTHLSPVLRELIGKSCASVHLGKPEQKEAFDHVLDTGQSLNDITSYLRALMEAHS